jgi:hypothetical protein
MWLHLGAYMPSPRRVPQGKPARVASCDEFCSPPVFLFELLPVGSGSGSVRFQGGTLAQTSYPVLRSLSRRGKRRHRRHRATGHSPRCYIRVALCTVLDRARELQYALQYGDQGDGGVGWRFRLVPILTGRASNFSRSVSVVEGEIRRPTASTPSRANS